MKIDEAIERTKNLRVKAEVALSNSNTSCEWLKEDVRGTITAFTMAIEALEKQIPKKPSRWQDGYSCCSNCKRGIIKEDRFCCYCGQAIDWSEVE